MNRAKPALRIVLDPRTEMREIFAELDELERMRKDCFVRLKDARKRYAEAENLCCLPSLEKLKGVVG